MLDVAIPRRLAGIKHVILVLSGKGGVGKSSVTTQLALSLYDSTPTTTVGVLDVDLTGPSIPRMFSLDKHAVHQSSDGWVPVYADGSAARLACMSVGFLLKSKEDSVVWRGPKKNAMIRQFLSDVRWGNLDYLIVDTPPGTSDEHLSLIEHLAPIHQRISAVLVTTPQVVALLDVLKCISFTRTTKVKVLGLIENMSGFVCPCCGESTNVFSTGGGAALAQKEGIPFLSRLPLDPDLVELLDGSSDSERSDDENGFSLLNRYKATSSFTSFSAVLPPVIDSLSVTS